MKKLSLFVLALLTSASIGIISIAKPVKPTPKAVKTTVKRKQPIFLLSCNSCTYPYDYIVKMQYNPSTQSILNVDVYDTANNLVSGNAYNVFSSVTQSTYGYTFSNFYVKVGSIMVNSSGEYRR